MITAVALSPSLDVTYVVDDLHGIQRPHEVHRMAGGKALNAARAAASLGATVTVLTVLGGGTGTMIAAEVRRADVELLALDGEHTTRTCISVFARDDGTFTEIYEHPTLLATQRFEDLLALIPGLVRERPGWCLVSGGVPAGLGPDALARVVHAAQGAGAKVAVDSHGPALRATLSTAPPDLLKVNRAEAAEVLDAAADTDLAELARALHARTGSLTVLTDGTAGAVATDGRTVIRGVLPGTVGTFPVGSGDSFLGGLAVALDRGESLADAVRLATACATANALVPGAARFDLGAVSSLRSLVQISELLDGVSAAAPAP